MPLDQPLSPIVPPWRPSRRLDAVWTAGAGVAVLAGLTIGGWVDPGPALVAAALVAGAGLMLTRQARAEPAVETLAVSAAAPRLSTASQPVAPLAQALEALNEPIMVVAAQEPDDLIARQIVFANASARALFRVPREGALLVKALRTPEVLSSVERALFGAQIGDVPFDPGGAQARSWRACSAPLSAEDLPAGAVRHAVLVFRDETDARRTQRMNADFLANASHELRTPLASLTGFIETLRGNARDDPEAREKFLGIMAAQADRMARLVSDLLSLSRIELNEHVPPSGEADLAAIARDVADALSPQARAREVRIVVEGAAGPALVEGDRDQILQVIQNLLDNAVKYSPGGDQARVKIQGGLAADALLDASRPGWARLSLLTPDRAHADQRYVAVRVADSGPGIEREHLPRLTERFYRVEGQKSGDRLGTGLGLAIVKHVVNRHRGGLMVESRAGEGTVFTAWFPEAAREIPALASAA